MNVYYHDKVYRVESEQDIWHLVRWLTLGSAA